MSTTVLSSEVARREFGSYMEGFTYPSANMLRFDFMAKKFDRGWGGEGYFGKNSSGISSNADLNANEDGFSFYESMWVSFRKWKDGGAQGNFSRVFKFKFSNYEYPDWNELKVKSTFVPYVKVNDTNGIP